MRKQKTMPKFKVVPIDISRRSLNSKGYLLSERENLPLFGIICLEDEDEDIWSNDPVAEFWATSEETALVELANNLKAYLETDLDEYNRDLTLADGAVVEWVRKVRPELLDLSYYPSVQHVASKSHEVAYVVKKMAELVHALADAEILYDIVALAEE